MCPDATSSASQEIDGSLSWPVKPPIPATFESSAMIAQAAFDWLETASVPPPCEEM
jgi:hypothetical protein